MEKLKRIFSPLILLLAAIIWGFAFVAQDAADTVPAFTLGAARSLLGAIFLFALIPVLDRLRGSERRLFSRHGVGINKIELASGAVLGVVLAIASVFQQLGISSGTDGGKAAFITALYIVFVPIYALALKRRASLNAWVSVGIAAAGFYLLCIRGDFSIAPSDMLVALCALIFPIHILLIDRYSPLCDGVRMSAVQFLSATVVNTVFALIFEGVESFSTVGDNLLPILYLGIGSSGIAYTLQIIGQRGSDPTSSAIILSLESVFGVIGTAVILHQTLTPREYIGCAVLLVAVLLSQINPVELIKEKRQNIDTGRHESATEE